MSLYILIILHVIRRVQYKEKVWFIYTPIRCRILCEG